MGCGPECVSGAARRPNRKRYRDEVEAVEALAGNYYDGLVLGKKRDFEGSKRANAGVDVCCCGGHNCIPRFRISRWRRWRGMTC